MRGPPPVEDRGTDRPLQWSPPYAGGPLARHMSLMMAFGRTKLRNGTNHPPMAQPSRKRRSRTPNDDRFRYERLVQATSRPNAVTRNNPCTRAAPAIQSSTVVTTPGSTVCESVITRPRSRSAAAFAPASTAVATAPPSRHQRSAVGQACRGAVRPGRCRSGRRRLGRRRSDRRRWWWWWWHERRAGPRRNGEALIARPPLVPLDVAALRPSRLASPPSPHGSPHRRPPWPWPNRCLARCATRSFTRNGAPGRSRWREREPEVSGWSGPRRHGPAASALVVQVLERHRPALDRLVGQPDPSRLTGLVTMPNLS